MMLQSSINNFRTQHLWKDYMFWETEVYEQKRFAFWMINVTDFRIFRSVLHQKESNEQKLYLEKIMASESQWAYWYAYDILNSRFQLGEPTIAMDPEFSYYYARNVINGPWPPGEAIIATNVEHSLYYAFCVLNARFKLGEATISSYADDWFVKDYEKRFGVKL